MGAHNLAVGELSEELGDKKGEAYLKAVEEEFGEHRADEGSEEDNEETSDKLNK